MAEHVLRPLGLDDLAAASSLLNRADRHDGVAWVVSEEELAAELASIDLATDSRGVDVDGVLAGFAYTLHLPSEERAERCYVFGATDPGRRGRGIGRALLTWGADRGRAQLQAAGRDLPRFLRVDRTEAAADAHRLYGRLGFRPVRWFEELLRPLGDPLPPAMGAVPAGVEIVRWPDDRDEELRAMKNTAFADHWGSTPLSTEQWAQLTRGFGARLDLSFVALDAATGAAVGHCLCKRFEADDTVSGRREGWIDDLGTRREWRGRGVATALIAHALQAFRSEGLTHAALWVDADSPTGASRLYHALGFVTNRRSITHEIRC